MFDTRAATACGYRASARFRRGFRSFTRSDVGRRGTSLNLRAKVSGSEHMVHLMAGFDKVIMSTWYAWNALQ